MLAILPFYLATGLDLRTVRLFRLFRILRIFKLLKYSKALKRFQRAFLLVKEEMLLFGFVALITLYLSAVGIYYFEHVAQPEQFQSIFHSLWWALITLTTVGYGDMYPITMGGKFFTFIVLVIGLGLLLYLLDSSLQHCRKHVTKRNKCSGYAYLSSYKYSELSYVYRRKNALPDRKGTLMELIHTNTVSV